MNNSLYNAKILVTRPKQQADALCQLIHEHGGEAIALPTLEITASDNSKEIQKILATVDEFQWLVFISANAVNFALLANGGKIATTKSVRFVAIGQATAQAMRQAGLAVDLIPEQGYNSEALLAMPELQQIAGQRFLIIRGDGGREVLAHTLHARGASVDYLTVYNRSLPHSDNRRVIRLLAQQQLQAVTISSGETLQNLLILVGEQQRSALLALPLIVISERIKQIAMTMGFKRIAVSASPANTAILETIIMVLTGEERERIE